MPDHGDLRAIDARLRAVTEAFAAAAPPAPALEDLLTLTPEAPSAPSRRRLRHGPQLVLAAAAVLLAVVLVAALVLDRSDDPPSLITDQLGSPEALVAAERFTAEPSAAALAYLFDAIGGVQGAELGIIDGAFDLVTIDPLDSNRVLLSRRDDYVRGEANGRNEDENTLWELTPAGPTSALFRPDVGHDSASFNRDGSVTLWAPGGSVAGGLVPRHASVLGADGSVIAELPDDVFPQRWAVDGALMLALVWADADTFDGHGGGEFDQLVLSHGGGPFEPIPRNGTEWLGVPMRGIVVASAGGPSQATRVWDSATGQQLADHALAGLPLVRVTASADGSTALGVDLDGNLVSVDLATGSMSAPLGTVDVGDVLRPLALSDDATVAITIAQDGTVTLWWLADGEPVLSFRSDAAPPRELDAVAGGRVTSAVAPDATRVVRRNPAEPAVGISWTVLDTDVDSWLATACSLAGRAMTPAEREDAGLPPGPGVCG